MVEPTQLFTLTQDDAIDILQSIDDQAPVQLVALDCNWGPPVSGRFDSDFLQVWVAADSGLNPRRITLVGTGADEAWDIELDLSLVGTVGSRLLVHGFSASSFPVQFVIRMEAGDGTLHYDNNGGYGVNYTLEPYAGRVTSAVAGSRDKTGPGAAHGALWLLPKFTRYRLVARSGTI